jgi:nitrite reductase/ring-hydroxylating ferredoxin subunit
MHLLKTEEQNMNWVKIAESVEEIQFGDNGLTNVEVDDKTICIAQNKDGDLAACAHKCPHAGGQMQHGFLDANGHIVCPLHRYRFSLQNGRNVSGEGYYLKTYAVKVDETGVYIGFAPKKSWLSWG